MINYLRFQFAAAPMTGETWFVDAAKLVGFGEAFLNYATTEFDDRLGSFRLSMVCHPIEWLSRCWDAMQSNQLDERLQPTVESLGKCDRFEDFASSWCYCFPGAIGKLFLSYRADSVMRLEDQPEAFVEFVESFGNGPEQWRAKQLRPPALYRRTVSKDLSERIVAVEHDLCEHYDYW